MVTVGVTLLGWIAVIGAVICFGSFAVPIKFPSVQNANVHPFVFQTYKSFWVFTTAWITLSFTEFSFTWWGCVSAIFWVPSGAAYVMAVDRIGIGITQAIVSSLVITVSVIWGLLFFDEPIKDLLLATVAFLLLAGGVSTMAYFSVPDKNTPLIRHSVLNDGDEESQQQSPFHDDEQIQTDLNLSSPLLVDQNNQNFNNNSKDDDGEQNENIRVSYAQHEEVEYLNHDSLWEKAKVIHVGRDEDFIPFYTIRILASGVEKGTVFERIRPIVQNVAENQIEIQIDAVKNENVKLFEKKQDVEYRNKDGSWEAARIESVLFDEDLIPYYTITIISSGVEKGTVSERLRELNSVESQFENDAVEYHQEEEKIEKNELGIIYQKLQDVEYRNKDGSWEAARIESVSFDEDLIPYYTITIISSGVEKGTVSERLRDYDMNHRTTDSSISDEVLNTDGSDSKDPSSKKSVWVGVAAACFNGIWGGSVMVPLKLASRGGAKTGGIEFVLSFGIGVSIITTLGWILFALYGKFYQQPLPSLKFSVLMIPGSIAGILWSVGNFCSMYAVLALGEAVGYSSCQAAVMVSGFWGLFYFGEAPRGKAQWLLGAVATTGGIILLSSVTG